MLVRQTQFSFPVRCANCRVHLSETGNSHTVKWDASPRKFVEPYDVMRWYRWCPTRITLYQTLSKDFKRPAQCSFSFLLWSLTLLWNVPFLFGGFGNSFFFSFIYSIHPSGKRKWMSDWREILHTVRQQIDVEYIDLRGSSCYRRWMKHIKQVFFFSLHRARSRSQTHSSSSWFPRERRRTAGPFSLSLSFSLDYLRPKPQLQRKWIEIYTHRAQGRQGREKDGDGQGRATWLGPGSAVHLAWATRTASRLILFHSSSLLFLTAVCYMYIPIYNLLPSLHHLYIFVPWCVFLTL